MNIHDRILSVYKNQMPDKTPLSIYKRYLPSGVLERELRNNGMGIIEYIPVVTMLPPPWHILPGFLSEISNCNLNITYVMENGNYLERREFSTPVGKIYQEIMRDSGGVGSEHIHRNYIQEPNDYKIIQWLIENCKPTSNEAMIKSRIKDLGDDGIVIGRLDRVPYQKLLVELAEPERFLLDSYDEPEIIEELLQTMDSKMDEVFEMAIESSVEVLWQPDNITADMTSPPSFEKFCLPYYQKHSKQAKSVGKPYLIHMDGKIKALTNLINQSGFDAIESVSIPEMEEIILLQKLKMPSLKW